MRGSNLVLVAAVIAVAANAQSFSKATPPIVGWIDISGTGTAVSGTLADDSEHNFVTTVGNSWFPAGNVRVGSNGALVSGITTGEIGFTNNPIPTSGLPSGMPAGGSGYMLPFWDDLAPTAGASNIFWDEVTVPGVLIVQWNNYRHLGGAVGEYATFQVQIFDNPPLGVPFAQFLYQDVIFSPVVAYNEGTQATIGYLNGTDNAQFSHNTTSVFDGDCLSIAPPFILAFTSPLGPGSIQVDITGGTPLGGFFWVVTFAAGNYPNGWFLGLDITVPEILALYGVFPFSGALDGTGSFSLGPIGGLPSFSLYGVAMGFDTPVLDLPTKISKPTSITL